MQRTYSKAKNEKKEEAQICLVCGEELEDVAYKGKMLPLCPKGEIYAIVKGLEIEPHE